MSNKDSSIQEQDAANLALLLKALGAGARAVQGLPLSSDSNKDNNDEYDNDDDDDAFAFESSFPEFAVALSKAQESERTALVSILQEIANHTTALDYNAWDSGSTAELLELSATACELLLDQVELYLNDSDSNAKKQLSSWSHTARRKSLSTWQIIVNNTVDMEKPQTRYKMRPPCNGRTEIFVPAVHPDKPFGVTPPTMPRLAGHGHDTAATPRSGAPPKTFPPDIVAPSHHVPHYYQAEMEAFSPTTWEFEPLTQAPDAPPPSQNGTLSATWIDTPEALQALGDKLSSSSELQLVALDLEAHAYRSFAGMVCLIQLTALGENYLIDTLQLSAEAVNRALQPTLANPQIVKLLHGADSDMLWLQRDFGLYVVHLFDTGRAARALRFSSASFAYLLQRYYANANDPLVTALLQDKQHFQLSDWRQRPLPLEMRHYATADTYYLWHMAHHLKWELQQSKSTSMEQVLEDSRRVSLLRYPGPPLFAPQGYRALLLSKRRKHKAQACTPRQEAVLAALWEWRDATARRLDESIPYICPNPVLLQLAMSTTGLPSHVKLATEALDAEAAQVIQTALAAYDGQEDDLEEDDVDEELNEIDDNHADLEDDVPLSPAPHKPWPDTPQPPAPQQRRRGMMSPVLGTEALYQQAGWMTPQEYKQQHHHKAESPTTKDVTVEEEPLAPDLLNQAVDDIPTTTASSEGEQPTTTKGGPTKKVHKVSMDTSSSGGGALDLKGSGGSGNNKVSSSSQPSSSTPRRGGGGSSGGGRFRTKGSSKTTSVDGYASARAARDASKSPSVASKRLSLEEEAKAARQSSNKIRNELKQQHHKNVLGLLSTTATSGEDEESLLDEGGGSGNQADGAALTGGEPDGSDTAHQEVFSIPRSMREIYKISNRNRRNKKTGSPTPERGATPTNEKELEELQKAEALLRDRGMEEAGFLFQTADSKEQPQQPTTASNKKAKSGDHVDTSADRSATKEEDIAAFRKVGWISKEESNANVLDQCYAHPHAVAAAAAAANSAGVGTLKPPPGSPAVASPPPGAPSPYDYAQMNTAPLHPAPASNNPFFAGAALQGGPLAQGFRAETTKGSGGGGRKGGGGGGGSNRGKSRGGRGGNNNSNNQERPEKRDGSRSHAYRSHK